MLSKDVIGIDFGASFTKLAFRAGFSPGRIQSFEERQACPLKFKGDYLIPTLAIETGKDRKPWVFGKEAAGMKPGPGMTVHRNWKSRLLTANGEPPDAKTMEVAFAFFGWLLEQLKANYGLHFDTEDAAVMLCVPAFQSGGAALTQLAAVMEQAGWTNEFILRTTEPKANTIGFCTAGRNIRTVHDTPNWGDMFGGDNNPFIKFTRIATTTEPATLAVLDIGSFTSDLSLANWHPASTEDYLDDGTQVSFRHGVVEQLDALCLPEILDEIGESIDELDFAELEALKEKLYRGQTYDLSGYTLGDNNHQRKIKAKIAAFCDTLWKHVEPVVRKRSVKWCLLTGGGANIPALRQNLEKKFQKLSEGTRPPLQLALDTTTRCETALGATSLILFKGTAQSNVGGRPAQPRIQPLPPLRSCTCQGINPQCMRCGGSGILPEDQKSTPARPSRITNRPARQVEVEADVEELELGPEEITPPDDTRVSRKDALRIADKEIAAHTLEGWMGTLVFGTKPGSQNHRYGSFRKILESPDEDVRVRAWYRLLCLACALGTKVPRSTIQVFWETTLELTGFWEITTGRDRDSSKLDKFFEDLIHREFRSIYAEGENAELLRRVFYDFRKLHFLVYENDFVGVIREILAAVDDGANPVLFLRSGALPNSSIWKGVIGQSMTSPLLFLMREWRRAEMISSNRMDHHCYYMNTAARRGACRKGWLKWDEDYYAYSLPDILEASRKVHEKLQETKEWDPRHFDIPLQILGGVQSRRRS